MIDDQVPKPEPEPKPKMNDIGLKFVKCCIKYVIVYVCQFCN